MPGDEDADDEDDDESMGEEEDEEEEDLSEEDHCEACNNPCLGGGLPLCALCQNLE